VASSSGARWRLACDRCDASAWVGVGERGFDAWCEACQHAQSLNAVPDAASRCARCGTQLSAAPRFVELWGMLQHLDAVLAAWAGDATPLATLLPERPMFLTDLNPPAAEPDDPAPLRAQLAALARGDWQAVRAAPAMAAGSVPAVMRAHAARAIAHERAGDPAAAITAWGQALAVGEDERARLARGALLARAGRVEEAREDLEHAGGSFAARWSRAALLVTAAVRTETPDAGAIGRARAEAGTRSAYWSDPTVGRLLFSLLVARALATDEREPRHASDAERSLLRAAERELEYETFWDRALVLVGWVRVGAPDEVERVAQPLAHTEAGALAAEPALTGTPLAAVATALGAALRAIAASEPARARAALADALARADLRRFRIPCVRCGRGTVGVGEVLEVFPAED